MQHSGYRIFEAAAPATEPVSVAEAKAHLHLAHDGDDTILATMIAAARTYCETYTGRAFISRAYKLYLDRWPGGADVWWDGVREGAFVNEPVRWVEIRKAPLLSVESLKVYDATGASATVSSSDYIVDTKSMPGRLVLRNGAAVPLPGQEINGIEIDFTAGYGASSGSVPDAIRQAVLQLVAHLYENRGDASASSLAASGAENLLTPYRLRSLL